MKELPIIYVRGYAGTQGDVEETVDDPFCGFNKGSTHVRVGPDGDAQFFGFESPLVRLITDFRYIDAYRGGIQELPPDLSPDQKRRSVWIYRYYDPTSLTFAGSRGKRLSIEEAAKGLADLVGKVEAATGAEKVLLVAHSMGGLVCRSLIQKIYPESGVDPRKHVDKLFTFGTPHGGIHFENGGGILEWVRDQVGWNNSDDFGDLRMYQYLTEASDPSAGSAPAGFAANDLQGSFPPERVFCLIGTNAHDYDVAAGMSRRTVGPQSDGLVQIRHAYVKGSSRAYVHRSHSGRYGMVNSEEGFQNLQRFLFGEVRVEMSLQGLSLPQKDGTTYCAEVGVSIRGLPALMHDQCPGHLCPVDLGNGSPAGGRVPLYTSFLMPGLSATGDRRSRFVIYLGVHSVEGRAGLFSFKNHLEDVPLWSDYLEVELFPTPGDACVFGASYSWRSVAPVPCKAMELLPDPVDGRYLTGTVALPPKGRAAVGKNARLCFKTSDWE